MSFSALFLDVKEHGFISQIRYQHTQITKADKLAFRLTKKQFVIQRRQPVEIAKLAKAKIKNLQFA
jgi:hypothetical protein